jgi:hypothetical protein
MSTSKRNRLWKNSKWVILATLILLVVVPFLAFPSERDYQELVENAESIELQYLPAPNYTRHFTMTTIPGNDRESILKLSASIDFHGVWGPFTDLSGNVYRIRVTKKNGSRENIIVLGANKIRYGNWNIGVSPKAVATIKQVVIDSGGTLPNKDILMEMLKAKNGQAE